ncbi:MAG TPA: electron transport complex subunit RsxC [Candidatus Pullichristensenella excrementigallinarum]|uniref:Ion-translocating oxidoreductase complex subunit C n=1 Tax=Candidatus Pullichristensenella excrementigallinarum TaxID=2840907 RepID=A0A9D1LCJ9_9FIRM|nr:electron transport complex subunit RsxC [Candidatus Pullichristensenella excrementigallinarum]
MYGRELALEKTYTFRRGIHPQEEGGGKRVTGAMPIEDAARPSMVAIALSQSVGAACKPLVKPGDHVFLGQKIGEPAGFVGAPVHASVSGIVKGIQARTSAGGPRLDCVVIESDGLDEWDPSLHGAENPEDPKSLLQSIREAGVVGLGGAAFPTHIKLSPPPEKKIDYVILNGAECEPYLTSDHRTMLEEPAAIVDGLLIAAKIVGATHKKIGIELNKPDAIAALRQACEGKDIEICPLQVKYPQGGEKQLIQAITGRQVPSGKLPMDAGCVVVNVSTAAAISRAVRKGLPIIDRVVTVTGAIRQPKNLRVRLGVDIESIIEQCGGALDGVNKIVLGGPMMGLSAYNPLTPVVKGTSGILLMIDPSRERPLGNCMRCATCVSVCPIGLVPLQMYALARKGFFERARDSQHLLDCVECGCCAYACPAKLPLVQTFRAAKRALPRK